jgi:signal transduction histidine kinase
LQERVSPSLQAINDTTDLLTTISETAAELDRFILTDLSKDSLDYIYYTELLKAEADSLIANYPSQEFKTDSLEELIDSYIFKLDQINDLETQNRMTSADMVLQLGLELHSIERRIKLLLSQLSNKSNKRLLAEFEDSQYVGVYLFLSYIILSIFMLGITYLKLIKPLQRLRHEIKQLSHGSFSHIEIERDDEIGDLIEAFNETSHTLEKSKNKLKESYKELETANKELESFAYSVSHDLRSPLRSISGFSEALVSNYADDLDDKAKDYLNRVHRAAIKMGELIDEILKLSRISRREINRETVDITKMAHEIIELTATSETEHYTYSITEGLSIYADEGLTKIVLLNILSNAIKFSQKTDQPVIEVGETEVNGVSFIYVSDNGAGFDMKYIDKVYGAFQRLHDDSEYKGTGIGLATVKRIINKHRGEIFYESEKNEGTTAYFNLGNP